ncbi:MAG: dienelactone hydrolase family protein [Azospirillum sp.]|nr:dienelactone hydrolase family protein [Azospirillum sp.]
MADVTIAAADGGSFSAYLAKPASGTGPGILVAQEIFGVNHVMRELCDGLAAQGYVALCPDLFWRQEPGIQITDRTEAEWARAFQLFQGFDVDLGVDDLIAAYDYLRGVDGCSGKVACVGYCLGGKLAFLMATRSGVDAAVSYYGVGLDELVDEAGQIANPLLMHMAELDGFVPPEAQVKIKAALAGHPKITLHSYAGVDHAFARIGGEHYNPAAAELANQRSAAFLAENLK